MEIIGRVLLIETKKCDREVFPTLLRKIGFLSIVAESLDEAYALLKSEQKIELDIIILSRETITPACLDFIDWVKKFHSEIKVLATSCRIEDKKSCESMEAKFVCKPITDFLEFKKHLVETLPRKEN